VESVRRHTRGVDYSLEILDNGSGPGVLRYLSARRKAKQLTFRSFPENIGKAAAINRAVAADRRASDWYVVLDDDAQAGPSWLQRLLSAAKRQPAASILGCRSVYPDGRIHSAEMFSWFDGVGAGEIDEGQRSYSRYCDAVTGVCLMIRRDVFETIRFWERLRQPNEDGDFCLAARKSGRRIYYCGDVAILHESLHRWTRYHEKNQALLRAKWGVGSFPDSHPIDVAYARLWNSLKNEDWRGVVRDCRRLAPIDPVPVYAWGFMGFAQLRLGRREQARRSLETALAQRSYKPAFAAQLLRWRAQGGRA
jgi:GT2 family glycosyltransferase